MDTPPFRVRTVGDVTVVSVGGTLGEPLAGSGGLYGLVEQGADKIVVDLDGVPFLSSSNLGQLIFLQRKCKQASTQYRLCCPQAPLREVFQITRLDQLIPVFDTLDEALDGF